MRINKLMELPSDWSEHRQLNIKIDIDKHFNYKILW